MQAAIPVGHARRTTIVVDLSLGQGRWEILRESADSHPRNRHGPAAVRWCT